MADSKQEQDKQGVLKPGDARAFGTGVQPAATQPGSFNAQGDPAPQQGDGSAVTSNHQPRAEYPNPDRPDETVPGGAFIKGEGDDAYVVDANGKRRDDFKVQDGKIVPAK